MPKPRVPENVNNLVDQAGVNGVQTQNHARNAPDDCCEILLLKIKLLLENKKADRNIQPDQKTTRS